MQKKSPLRLLDSSDPVSVQKLTEFLNVVYQARAKKGVDYLPSNQGEETTRRRIEGKECRVAEIDGRIVGTFTVSAPENTRGSWWYRQAGVAEVSQLAVHPNFRMLGIFSFLMDAAEQRALEMGALELSGSTPARQKQLLTAYIHRGHRIVDYKWSKNASYGCVIFSKTLQGNGVKSTLLRRISRKVKYSRHYIRYKLCRRAAGKNIL